MEYSERTNRKEPPRFRPVLCGCVTGDPGLARAVAQLCGEEIGMVASYTYRSILAERQSPAASELFERFARDSMERYRTLGDLILALGGDPGIRTEVRSRRVRPGRPSLAGRAETPERMRDDSVAEERRLTDRYQTLMGRTDDPVVRSVFSGMIAETERHVAMLTDGT